MTCHGNDDRWLSAPTRRELRAAAWAYFWAEQRLRIANLLLDMAVAVSPKPRPEAPLRALVLGGYIASVRAIWEVQARTGRGPK